MRRSICSCEPVMVFAGETSTWRFAYTSSIALPKGARVKFDMLSEGREGSWQIPQTDPQMTENLIWGELPNGTGVDAQRIGTTSAFEFILPSEVRNGETFVISLGTPGIVHAEWAIRGNTAQSYIQRRRPFYIYVDPKGKGEYREPEIFTLDVKGHVLKHIRAVVPSLVARNRRFDILVRFEDRFGNPTGNASEGTLIELTYEHLRDNLSWKLFVPETGFINLPNLYFNEAGIYRIQLKNLSNGEKFFSSPIICLSESDKSISWGVLHGESVRYDATASIELLLRHCRDDVALQFYASSCFESEEETTNEDWKLISSQIHEFNEEGRFVALLGLQWFHGSKEEGLRQMIYSKDNKPLLRKKDAKFSSLQKIYKSHNFKDLLSIPCFTMGKGMETVFTDIDPDFERVVEIYNAWGCSECTVLEGNLRPIRFEGSVGITEVPEGSIRSALSRNIRLGFVAGGYDDRGVYRGLYETGQVQYSPGLTAVISTEQSREQIVQALYNRSCYATTGEKIVLGFFIAGMQMGSELTTKHKPGLMYNRHIVGYVAATALIAEIAFIRNGKIFHTLYPPLAQEYEFAFDDGELLGDIALPGGEDVGGGEKSPFVYYYMRVVQKDGHIAWSSPIWIDCVQDKVGAEQSVKRTRIKRGYKNA